MNWSGGFGCMDFSRILEFFLKTQTGWVNCEGFLLPLETSLHLHNLPRSRGWKLCPLQADVWTFHLSPSLSLSARCLDRMILQLSYYGPSYCYWLLLSPDITSTNGIYYHYHCCYFKHGLVRRKLWSHTHNNMMSCVSYARKMSSNCY